jgi:Flp pilus assembly protein TadG
LRHSFTRLSQQMKLGFKISKRGERGAMLLLFTMMVTLVVIPMVGLAIDASIVFWAKAKLSAAVDAAALAAGRNINLEQTTADNKAPVVIVGKAWFWANFPNGWMGTSVVTGIPTVLPTQNVSKNNQITQQVVVSATVDVPLYFMRVLGFKSMAISASAISSRRQAYVVLVLDRSGSMGSPPVGSGACPIMKADSIKYFVDRFIENFDTVSLITYSSTAGPNPDFGPSQQFTSGMTNKINQIQCTGATSMAQALQMAYQSILKHGVNSGLNTIVLFTDGQPNEIVGWFRRYNPAAKTYRYGSEPGSGPQNYNTLYQYAKTGCTQAFPTVAQGGAGFTILVDTNNLPIPAPGVLGMTGGMLDTTDPVQVWTAPGSISNPGCGFNNGMEYAKEDVAGIPLKDIWLNNTIGGYGSNPPYYGLGISAPDTFAGSDPGAGGGLVRSDEVTLGVMAASINAADYQAQAIRADKNFPIMIDTIGMDGAPDMKIDSILLERIANDPNSPIFDPSSPPGLFEYASDPTQLGVAFSVIVSQILRLSQ